jgi:hypothetical protein
VLRLAVNLAGEAGSGAVACGVLCWALGCLLLLGGRNCRLLRLCRPCLLLLLLTLLSRLLHHRWHLWPWLHQHRLLCCDRLLWLWG